MKKRVLVLSLAVVFAWLTHLTTQAAGDMYVGETLGIITHIYSDAIRIVGEPLKAGGFDDVHIFLHDAPVYDLVTGFPVALSQMQVGMSARAAYFVDDMPQPFPAVVLWLNSGESDAAVFSAAVSENIRYEGDYCVFLTADGRYRITLTRDTPIIDPLFGAMTIDCIFPGQEFFIWVDSITASCPALVFPEKVVLIH